MNHCNTVIGNDVMISSEVAFIGNDHPFDDSMLTLVDFAPNGPSRVTLMGDNLIGFRAIIRGPVTIGKGAIVGAGSLVTSDIPENAIAYGSPARVRSMRRPSTDE